MKYDILCFLSNLILKKMGYLMIDDNAVPDGVTEEEAAKYCSSGLHPSGPKSRALVRDSCVAC